MRLKHAVITDEHVIFISEEARRLCRVPLSSPVRHISDLWALGKRMSITHFWIMPETAVERMEWTFLEDKKDYNVFIPGEKKEDSPPRAATCRKEWGSLEIVVNYPDNPNGFDWIINHPLDILACIDYLQQMLGISDIKYSSQYIGKEYLKEKYKGTKRLMSYLRKPITPLPLDPFKLAGKCEVFFAQPLTLNMVGMTYHLYDKNSSHPSAASSMTTGCGDCVYLTDDIVPKNPGIYRVTLKNNPSIFDGVQLPTIIAREWITLDLLKFAMKKGCTFDIHEAYIFEQSHNIFGEWARDLWQIRQTLKNDTTAFCHPGGRQNAYLTLKAIMNFTIGGQGDNVNWWADMVSLSRVAKFANLEKFATSGVFPSLIYADDIGFITADPNYETAVPGIFERRTKTAVIDNRNEMGGYKHKYSVLITEDMVQQAPVFKKDNLVVNASLMLSFFKKYAREKGLIDE